MSVAKSMSLYRCVVKTACCMRVDVFAGVCKDK